MLAAPLSGLAPLDTVTSGAPRALRSMASALFVYRFRGPFSKTGKRRRYERAEDIPRLTVDRGDKRPLTSP